MIGDGPLGQVARRTIDLERAAASSADLLEVPVAGTFDPPGPAFLLLGDTRLLRASGVTIVTEQGNTVALVEYRRRGARAGA